MRKIKNFKIPIYAHEIGRKAKKAGINLEKLSLSDGQQLKSFVLNSASYILPSTIYDSFKSDKYTELEKYLPKPVPCTLSVVTIGKMIETKEEEADEAHKNLTKICAEVFLKTSINLVKDLALSDACQEGFTLGEPLSLCENGKCAAPPEFIMKVKSDFLVEKIAVTFGENGQIFPKYTAIVLFPWTPKKRKNAPK